MNYLFIIQRLKREIEVLKSSVATLTRSSVENELKKFMAYASRPLSEFRCYEALEMIEAIHNVAHDSNHGKADYYRLVYETARSKVDLPGEHFRSLLLRLIGDKDHEKVFDTVTKFEKNMRQKPQLRSDRLESSAMIGVGRFRQASTARPLCFYCKKLGHFKAQCRKRIADNQKKASGSG